MQADIKSPLEALELGMGITRKTKAKSDGKGDDRVCKTTTSDNLPVLPGTSTEKAGERRLPTPPPAQRNRRGMDDSKLQLELELSETQRAALNNGTSANYLHYLNSYLDFCEKFDYQPFPLKEKSLSMFAQFLSRRLKPQTIRIACSALRTISLTAGYQVTEKQFPLVSLTIRGIGNLNPAPVRRANPMTIRILLAIRENLNLNEPFHATMWALFLTSFFLILRKSNVTPDKEWEDKYMRRKHIQFTRNGVLITLYWTKTIQAGERALQFPLFTAEGSPVCPVWAIRNMVRLSPLNGECPAFGNRDGTPISYYTFNTFLKDQIKNIGLSDNQWSTHCFRRGGTSYLAACGIEERQLKLLGDWKSDCFKQYIHCPWQEKLTIATKIKQFLITQNY